MAETLVVLSCITTLFLMSLGFAVTLIVLTKRRRPAIEDVPHDRIPEEVWPN